MLAYLLIRVLEDEQGVMETLKSMEEGMNLFLKELNISLRRDKESSRPRINKVDSVLDREQKSKNKLYYV